MQKTFNKWFSEDFSSNPQNFSIEFGSFLDFSQKNVWKSVSFFETSVSLCNPVFKVNFKEREFAVVYYGDYNDMIGWDCLEQIFSTIEDIYGRPINQHYELQF